MEAGNLSVQLLVTLVLTAFLMAKYGKRKN